MSSVQKNLTDQYVDLIQIPKKQIELSFKGDINSDGELLRPVHGTTVDYLPMTFEIIPPKILPNTQAALDQNIVLATAQQDVNYVGVAMVSSDGFFEQTSEVDFNLALLKNMSPLILYINPSDLTRTMGKRTTPTFTGKNSYITEQAGEEQDKLSASGKIGAYYTNKTGLSRNYRRNSHSYQQLMHLYIYYRNNGYLFETKDPSRIALVGGIKISYDSEYWIGQFDSFSMSESADNPYSMDYSFEFTAREHYNNTSLSSF